MNKLITGLLPLRPSTMSRDKADTLLLLLTCCFVLVPFMAYNPTWLNLAVTALMLWRAWISLRGHLLPEKWQLTVVTAILSAGVYFHFHVWLSKDAGIAFLIVLICLKMLELHARRDAVAVIFVCYFLLVGQLLYSQSLLAALYLIFCTGLLISTQLAFQYHQLTPTFSVRLLNGYKVVAMAMPLALILFVFFPRFQGPLWGKQQGNISGITGLSDSMEPGNIAELALSDQIAFRVKFPGYTPSPLQLYWRAIVLDSFDGKRWSASLSSRIPVDPAPMQNVGVIQELIMEPHNRHWLFGLDRPDHMNTYNGTPVARTDHQYGYLNHYGEMRSPGLIQDRIRYTVTSNLNGTDAFIMPKERIEVLGRALQLPGGTNPLTVQWAQDLSKKGGDHLQLANLILRFFHEQPFRYTLDPPPTGTNQTDDFMFTTQAGFCEHYASAFVVIMRAMHIPARIVTGYQGGEINPVDGLMTVRQSDAHAWAEIWVEQRGWIRFDPTAAVAPDRVEHGIRSSFPNQNLTTMLGFSQITWVSDITRQLQSGWDAVNSAWNLWVLNYSLDKQKDLLSSLSGIAYPQAAQLGIAMMIAASLIVATLSLILLGKRQVISPPDQYYHTFCRHMRYLGWVRKPHEGAIDYCARLQLIFPEHPELRDFLTLYSECKYGKGYNPTQRANLKQLLKLCLQLKSAHANLIDSPT